MYKGTNPTALRSQQWLAEALIELMSRYEYSKITIKDVCTQADISRQTFYQFYSSKDDIIRYCVRAATGRLISEMEQKRVRDPAECLQYFFRLFVENEAFTRVILDNHLEHLMMEEILCETDSLSAIVPPEIPQNTKVYANAFISSAITGTIMYWFKSEDRIDEKELAAIITKIIYGEFFPGTGEDR